MYTILDSIDEMHEMIDGANPYQILLTSFMAMYLAFFFYVLSHHTFLKYLLLVTVIIFVIVIKHYFIDSRRMTMRSFRKLGKYWNNICTPQPTHQPGNTSRSYSVAPSVTNA